MSTRYKEIDIKGLTFNTELPRGYRRRRHKVFKAPLPLGKGFYPEWDNVNKDWEGLFVIISYLPGVCRVKVIRESATSSWWDRDGSNSEVDEGVGVGNSSWEPCSFRFDTLAQGDPMGSGGVRIKVGDKYLSEEEIINLCYEAAIKCRRPISDKDRAYTVTSNNGGIFNPNKDITENRPSPKSKRGANPRSHKEVGPLGIQDKMVLFLLLTLFVLYHQYGYFPWGTKLLGTPGLPPEFGWLLLAAIAVSFSRKGLWVSMIVVFNRLKAFVLWLAPPLQRLIVSAYQLNAIVRWLSVPFLGVFFLVWRKKPRLPKIPGVEVKAFF